MNADAKTLDDALVDMGQSLDAKQVELLNALKTSKDTGTIAALQQELTMINQRFQQMYELIGNLRKSFHDMSMHSIGFIGR